MWLNELPVRTEDRPLHVFWKLMSHVCQGPNQKVVAVCENRFFIFSTAKKQETKIFFIHMSLVGHHTKCWCPIHRMGGQQWQDREMSLSLITPVATKTFCIKNILLVVCKWEICMDSAHLQLCCFRLSPVKQTGRPATKLEVCFLFCWIGWLAARLCQEFQALLFEYFT